jgi:hypothetical protein
VRGRRRKKGKTSDVILLVMGLFAAAFIVAMTVIFCVKGSVPDTLIQYTLGAGGVEALLLAGIKITKVRAGEGGRDDEEVS